MPELKPLPCPACGSAFAMADVSLSSAEFVKCCTCYMHGPYCDTEDAAIAAWNSLPRALTWTTEPPKVLPGFYFLKMASGTISMVYLAEADLMHNDWHGSIGQWVANAGPITPPRE